MSSDSNAYHRTNRFLAALEPEDFGYLAPHLEAVVLPKEAVLYDVGETLDHVYFPHDSIVSLVAVMENGGSAAMAVFGREGMIGLVTTVVTRQALGRYIVQMPGTASRITVDRMLEAIRTRPNLRQLFLRLTEALIARTLQNVACNAVHSVEARCCRWILALHDRLDQDTLPLTHEFLAEMLGAQRSTLSTTLRSLGSAGLIRQGRAAITVTDRAGLEEAACECYGTIRRRFERLLPGAYPRK